MKRLWLAKIFFALGVLAFVVRPFYGFVMMAKHHHPAENSILVKVFSKRGHESQDDCSFGISDFDKKLPHLGYDHFAGLPPYRGFVISVGFLPSENAVFLKRKLNLYRPAPAWLLNCQLII